VSLTSKPIADLTGRTMSRGFRRVFLFGFSWGLAFALTSLSACDGNQSATKNAKQSYWHYRIGKDYLKKKQPDAAKNELLKAVELDDENRDAHHLLGVIFFLKGVHAMNHVDRSQCLEGKRAKEQREAANRVFGLAEKSFKRVLELGKKKKSKTNSKVLNYLANIALHFAHYDEAIKLSSRALDNIMYTERQTALGTRGQAYFRKGDLEAASKDLRQAIFHQPKFCVGRFWLAKTYFKSKRFKDAIVELEKVVADKQCPLQEAHQLLGLCYLKDKQPQKARSQFEMCVSKNPNSCVSQECKRYGKLI
jgi:type IV pilus assembly protein PilF